MPELDRIEAIEREVRADWETLGVSTLKRIRAHVAAGRRDEAARLFDYCVEREFRPIVAIFVRWLPDLLHWTLARWPGGDPDPVFEESMAGWATAADVAAAQRAFLAPDGPFAGAGAADAGAPDAPWEPPIEDCRRFVDRAFGDECWPEREAELVAAARAALADPATPPQRAGDELARYFVEFRRVHDLTTDWTWGALSVIQRHLGEEQVGEAIKATASAAMIRGRTTLDQLSRLTAADITRLSAETMRAHLSGPDHEGDVEIVEQDDRFVVSFAPCGSGLRMERGDEQCGTPPRTGKPFGYLKTERAHDWTWGKEGVCLYCAHCAVANEILPIESLGYPKRVTEYPTAPDQPCRWLIYKDPREIPARYYERVGQRKPTRLPGDER